jgi:pyridoxamine 5'-phosphate oxidase
MRLDDLPPGFDDPVEGMLGFHRRIERQLTTLARIPAHVESRGVDAEASALAAGSVEFFGDSLALHHADEGDLLPLLEARAAAAGRRDMVRDVRNRMENEHHEMDLAWRTLRRPLESISEGMHRTLPAELMQYFRFLHARHIALEESTLHLEATRSLLPSDRVALGRGMVARRIRRRRFG